MRRDNGSDNERHRNIDLTMDTMAERRISPQNGFDERHVTNISIIQWNNAHVFYPVQGTQGELESAPWN